MSFGPSTWVATVQNLTNSVRNVNQTIGTVSSSAAPGGIIIAVMAADNLSAVDGPTNEHLQFNIDGFYFSKLMEYCYSGGGAGNGATLSIWGLLPFSYLYSGRNIQVMFDGVVARKGITVVRFPITAGAVADVAAGIVTRTDANTDPGALTIDTGIEGREHLFIRALAAETAAYIPSWTDGAMTPVNSVLATDIEVMMAYQISSVPSLVSDPTAAIADWASIGLALYERPGLLGTAPLSTLLDDFNRADGAVTSSAFWANKSLADSTVGNNLIVSVGAMAGTSWGEGSSAASYGPNVDFSFVVTRRMTGPGDFTTCWALANAGSSALTGYAMRISWSGGQWRLHTIYSSGTQVLYNTALAVVSKSTPAVGDSIWIAQRGNTLYCLSKLSGSSTWVMEMEVVDTTYNRSGPMGFSVTPGQQRIDDFRGGTVPRASSSSRVLV